MHAVHFGLGFHPKGILLRRGTRRTPAAVHSRLPRAAFAHAPPARLRRFASPSSQLPLPRAAHVSRPRVSASASVAVHGAALAPGSDADASGRHAQALHKRAPIELPSEGAASTSTERSKSDAVKCDRELNNGTQRCQENPWADGEERPPAIPLPRACVVRTMRHVIPENVRISALAKQLVQDSGGEFAAVVVNEAAERCRREDRRRMAPEDLLVSLLELGLQRYDEPMATYLRGGAAASNGGSAPPTAEDMMYVDNEFAHVLERMMDDAAAGGAGASSPAHLPGFE
ncbi:hypothetical protein ACP4OV_001012 [Aristida adscensionis]